jgi:TPR repeat protein
MRLIQRTRILSRASLLTSLLAGTAAVQAGPGYAEGVAAYQAGEYVRAADIMAANAALGDTKAKYFLGTLYQTGEGLEEDARAAARWYRAAAEDGLAEAQFQLGLLYLRGEGVEADEDQAFDWLWQAADRGYPQARDVLEYVLYERDFGIGC